MEEILVILFLENQKQNPSQNCDGTLQIFLCYGNFRAGMLYY